MLEEKRAAVAGVLRLVLPETRAKAPTLMSSTADGVGAAPSAQGVIASPTAHAASLTSRAARGANPTSPTRSGVPGGVFDIREDEGQLRGFLNWPTSRRLSGAGYRIRTGDLQLGNASDPSATTHTSKLFLTLICLRASQDVACCGTGSGVPGGVVRLEFLGIPPASRCCGAGERYPGCARGSRSVPARWPVDTSHASGSRCDEASKLVLNVRPRALGRGSSIHLRAH